MMLKSLLTRKLVNQLHGHLVSYLLGKILPIRMINQVGILLITLLLHSFQVDWKFVYFLLEIGVLGKLFPKPIILFLLVQLLQVIVAGMFLIKQF